MDDTEKVSRPLKKAKATNNDVIITVNVPNKQKKFEEPDDDNGWITTDSETSDTEASDSNELWKKDLSKEEIEKYEKQIKELKEKFKENEPTIPKILDSKLNDEEKMKLLELYEAYKLFEDSDISVHNQLKKLLNKSLNHANELTDSQLSKIKEVETKLNKLPSFNKKISLRHQVLLSDLSEKNMIVLLTRLDKADNDDSEASKINEIVDTALSVPRNKLSNPLFSTTSQNNINALLVKIKSTLDSNIYGLEHVKQQVLSIIAAKIKNPNANGEILTFQGSPGCGKTTFISSIGESLQIPKTIIPMGGRTDPEYLNGFLSTYKNSMPGRILTSLKELGCCDGIIGLDELDKIPKEANAMWGALIPILDPTQSTTFYDNYIPDFAIDISKVWFMGSCNDDIPNKVLVDRLHIIHIPDPSIQDKVEIAKRILVPRLLKELKYTPNDIIIPDSQLEYTIKKSKSKEAGVRQLNRNLRSMFKKINLLQLATLSDNTTGELNLKYTLPSLQFPITFTNNIVDTLFEEHLLRDDSPLWQLYT
jgi:ATP-dependent Lon protease